MRIEERKDGRYDIFWGELLIGTEDNLDRLEIENRISRDHMIRLFLLCENEFDYEVLYGFDTHTTELLDIYGESLLSIKMENNIVLNISYRNHEAPISEVIKEMLDLKIIK